VRASRPHCAAETAAPTELQQAETAALTAAPTIQMYSPTGRTHRPFKEYLNDRCT